ncbi:rubredoxin [Aldersonia kunmingensis]|uniref:rubredoxin n=1 Tax=Aldersonia kunmingensis TaxID=408066 RepID=UPI000A05E597|nr:rubredoxin [Aldersonia kunmingensis]
MSAYRCPVCEYVYTEAKGEPHEGFPPGTSWGDVPEGWCCPDCGVREKPDFEPVPAG